MDTCEIYSHLFSTTASLLVQKCQILNCAKDDVLPTIEYFIQDKENRNLLCQEKSQRHPCSEYNVTQGVLTYSGRR